MRKKRLLDDILQNPQRIYRTPSDVLRDRRLVDAERLEVLRLWRGSQHETGEIDALIMELEQRLSAHNHAAE